MVYQIILFPRSEAPCALLRKACKTRLRASWCGREVVLLGFKVYRYPV